MPTWNTMNELVTGDLVTEADMAALRENISYLLAPNRATAQDTGGYYATTSTAFVDVSPDTRVTLETHGGPVLVSFTGNAFAASASYRAYFDLTVDGVRVSGLPLGLLQQGDFGSGQDNARPVGFTVLVPDLAAGSHTFAVQWRVSSGATVTLLAHTSYTPLTLSAIEL